MENRIKRPCIAAALGVGAERAVLDMALRAEAATSRGEVVGTTLIELQQFHAFVEVSDYAREGLEFGLPRCIVCLAAHFYVGPRCIRVSQAYSKALFPRRSIIAGCTWAMVLIRLFVVAPAENFIQTLRKDLGE